jgi:hypothetical protein
MSTKSKDYKKGYLRALEDVLVAVSKGDQKVKPTRAILPVMNDLIRKLRAL